MAADYVFTDDYWPQTYPYWVDSNYPYWPIYTVLAELIDIAITDQAVTNLSIADAAVTNLSIANTSVTSISITTATRT